MGVFYDASWGCLLVGVFAGFLGWVFFVEGFGFCSLVGVGFMGVLGWLGCRCF
jgi:hypothetical protein